LRSVKTIARNPKATQAVEQDPLKTSRHLLSLVQSSLEDDKAEDAVVIELAGKSSIADYMVIATGRSQRQVGAMTDHIMRPVLELIRDRGLLFLDNGASGRDVSTRLAQDLEVPVAFNNRAVDGLQASREAIDARLAEVERIALTDGFAVAMGQPYPVTLERIATWAEDLDDRGFTLAPITALANRQALP